MSPAEIVIAAFMVTFMVGFIYVLGQAERDRRKAGFRNGRKL